ncbi:GPW/gp25 family protein [Bartonella sp. DGB2]|uniref:GPW/gp25 family protein n=1 Tax=Bartonella sp. DGB2 TaxID=3388426 RepID=UPI003990251A
MDHLRQSLIDILMTAKGSRVMRRAYGSDVARLLDQPVNAFFFCCGSVYGCSPSA